MLNTEFDRLLKNSLAKLFMEADPYLFSCFILSQDILLDISA